MNELKTLDKKQEALENSGATRERAYKTMVEGLTSVITIIDKLGEEHSMPDTSNRLKSAEMIARLYGDMKNDNVVETKTVELRVSGSVSELAELIRITQEVKEDIATRYGRGGQTGEVIDV